MSDIYLWAPPELKAGFYYINKTGHQSRPSLPEGEWERVDLLFEQMKPDIVMVLTEDSAERMGEYVYVFFEPLVDVVITLSHTERTASINYTSPLWELVSGLECGNRVGTEFTELTNQAGQLLQQGRLSDALILSIGKAWDILDQSPRAPRVTTIWR